MQKVQVKGSFYPLTAYTLPCMQTFILFHILYFLDHHHLTLTSFGKCRQGKWSLCMVIFCLDMSVLLLHYESTFDLRSLFIVDFRPYPKRVESTNKHEHCSCFFVLFRCVSVTGTCLCPCPQNIERSNFGPEAVPNGYPNPTRYSVFFSIPDPIQF